MKQLFHPASLIALMIAISSCGGDSTPAVTIPPADGIVIHFYKEHQDNPSSNRVFKITDPGEVKRADAFTKAAAAELYKCGYDGRIIYSAAGKEILDAEFNLSPDCRHLRWMAGNELKTAVLSESDGKWLEDMKAAPWDLSDLSFMLGSWYQVEAIPGRPDSAYSFENWNPGNSQYEGFSYTLVGKDTVFKEKLKLKKEGNEIQYVADVAQNAAPVPFTLVFVEGNFASFENPAHDWPQRISYSQTAADSLHARVEGTKDGEFGAKNFFLRRLIAH